MTYGRQPTHIAYPLHHTHIVIITVWTILVALLVVRHVLAKRLFALFARKRHLCRLLKSVVLRFCVALCAVEPLLAAWRAYRHLGVQDMFAKGSESTFSSSQRHDGYRPHRKRLLKRCRARLASNYQIWKLASPTLEYSSDPSRSPLPHT